MLVKSLRRRFPEECRSFKNGASSALRNHWGVHPTTFSKILNHHKFPGLLLHLVERVIRLVDRNTLKKGY